MGPQKAGNKEKSKTHQNAKIKPDNQPLNISDYIKKNSWSTVIAKTFHYLGEKNENHGILFINSGRC